MGNLEKQHEQLVKRISDDVKSFHNKEKKLVLYKGTTHSTRPSEFKKDEIVNIGGLNRVLSVDKENKFAVLEPNVPMDRLVNETLKYNLIPPVVMEFPGITAGGGIQGGAAESSSFRWGGFHDFCTEYEMILGNGNIVESSLSKNSDLYSGTACSYGSLGIITKIKMKLVEAKRFVDLKYIRVHSFEEAVKVMEDNMNEKVQFIDAIMFSKNLGVIMVGNLSDNRDLPTSTFLKASDDWFFVHAEKLMSKHKLYEEQIPLKDYLFRYDRGAFWMGKHGMARFHIPFNKLTRFFLNSFMGSRALYRAFHATNVSQEYLLQDMVLPKENYIEFLNYIDKKFGIYPLWLLPLETAGEDKLCPNYVDSKLAINVGVWGELRVSPKEFVRINREVEHKLAQLGGKKTLYAHTYYTEEEFWQTYDKPWYDTLREKYFADKVFSTVYQNTNVSGFHKPRVLRGIGQLIKSPFRLPISK